MIGVSMEWGVRRGYFRRRSCFARHWRRKQPKLHSH